MTEATAPDEAWPGKPYPLGATYDGGGTNFSLFSEVAERVELCLFDDDGAESKVELDEVDAFCWHAYLPVGRSRPALRLPRARTLGSGPGPSLQRRQAAARPVRQGRRGRRATGHQACYPYTFGDENARNDDDSAPFVPRSVVAQPVLRLGQRPAARRPAERVGDLRGARQGVHGQAP